MNNCDFYDYYVSMTSDRVASGMQAHGCRHITDEDTTTCVAEVRRRFLTVFPIQRTSGRLSLYVRSVSEGI